MTTPDDSGPILEWTGERYVPQVSGNIRLEHLHRYLLARELARGRRILDVACGEGYGSDLLAEVADYVVGVDIIHEVVRHAQTRYRRPNLAFAAGDCAAIPLTNASIDIVVSFETLEHHDQHRQMMQEIKRVLRPGGVVIISSPDRREYSEVPGYQNPFHAHELDRREFARLLESHFSQVRLVGQRIRAGSIVGPLSADDGSAFISFAETDSGLTRVEGVQAPLYFIGLASDGKVPLIPAGILDGGDFLWSAEHLAACAAAAAAGEKQTEGVRTVLQEEIARRGQRIDELERSRHELQVLTNDAHAHLEDARGRLGEMHIQLEGIASRLRQRDAEVRMLDGELAEQRAAAAASATAIGDLKHERDVLSAQVSVMERSHSWTLTAPLRASRRLAGRGAVLSRKLISDNARTAYRKFPLTRRREASHQGRGLPHRSLSGAAYGGVQGLAATVSCDCTGIPAGPARSRAPWRDRRRCGPFGSSAQTLPRCGGRLRPAPERRRPSTPESRRSRSICRSFIRFPRTTRGGARDSPSGTTSPAARHGSQDTISPTCRASWASTTFA